MSEYQTVFEAINDAARAMPSLRKGDRNAHGGYSYVSIDDFFEKAASVAHAHGLVWSVRETGAETVMVGEKIVGGKPAPTWAFKVHYEFDLIHVSGTMLKSFFSTTILHPLQGAQTAGSAMSYAAKLFMRNVFAIVTGEQDADATDAGAFDLGGPSSPPASKPVVRAPVADPTRSISGNGLPADADALAALNKLEQQARIENSEADLEEAMLIYKMATAFMPNATTKRELTKYWVDNERAFKSLETKDPETYSKLVAEFAARKKELSIDKGSQGPDSAS